jgi:dihydrofolate synthase/folylpolyglutamate synthase
MHSDAALDYLYSLGMFGIKLGLDNIRGLLQRLGNPQGAYPIVHVAGTNGKGSVCAFLSRICTRNGYRVGVYTSPHLHCFNERIRIGSECISTREIAELTAEIRAVLQDIQPTFFEFTTAMALAYFARCNVDLVVLEVGMGGRLDATNVVDPVLSVITPVAHDHAAYLGDSILDIAAEKGGIIKHGVPVVLGAQTPVVEEYLQKTAAGRNAPCYTFGADYRVDNIESGGGRTTRFDIVTPQRSWHGLTPGLHGRHQGENLGTALMALDILEQQQGFKVEPVQVANAIAETCWPGRLEWIDCTPARVLLDGAHNTAGMEALRHYLDEHDITSVHWVGGFKQDKEARELIPLLRAHTRTFYAVPVPVEEHWNPHDLVDIAAKAGMKAEAFSEVETALNQALHRCGAREIVLVAGSLFLVAKVRRILNLENGEVNARI